MTNATKKLEVGDVIYAIGRYGVCARAKISSVTAKRASTSYRVFKREVLADGWLTEIGAGAYPQESWQLATPERDAQWQEVKDRRVFKEDLKDLDNIPLDKVRAILAILQS